MIAYGYINGKLKKEPLEDISTNNALKILKNKKLNVKFLPGYGNINLKKKYIINEHNAKCSVKINIFNLFTSIESISISLLTLNTLSLIISLIILFFNNLLGVIGNLE